MSAIITAIFGIAWGLSEFNLIPLPPKIFEPLLTIFGAFTLILVFTLSLDKLDKQTASQDELSTFLEQVRDIWIRYEGNERGRRAVLEDALRDAPIQINLTAKPNAVTDSKLYTDYR